MSEAQEFDTTRVENEEDDSTRPTSIAVDEEKSKKSSNFEIPENPKTDMAKEESDTEPNKSLPTSCNEKKNEENVEVNPQSPTTKNVERSKPGECNLLPVLVERLRSALEQSCSSQSSDQEQNVQPEDSGVDSEEDLRVWASGVCTSMDQHRNEESQSPRGLKLDLKFLEDLLLSDIHTALARLQETLKRVDIGTLTRYSSTLDPTNKLNLLKLISSLLANLKIPEEAVKPEKAAKSQLSVGRRRRAERHTIGVSSEELARARKWLEEKSLSPNIIVPSPDVPILNTQVSILQGLERTQDKLSASLQDNNTGNKEISMERLDIDKQYDKVREKYMKDAINQQQSLQNKCKESQRENNVFYEPPGPKIIDTSYKDDNTIINEEYGISASSLYHQSNAQAKCNKFLAKKSKIKRANTIDIPNYLKLQAESLANNQGGCVSLRRPINIGDKYSINGGNAIPSFEPKTENDRKFLALINKNNETTATTPSASLPFKSFNYRQAVADKNWNNRFSDIKTTFDKPQDENIMQKSSNEGRRKSQSGENDVVVGSLRLPYNSNKQNKSGFSHAPTSPFQKIERPGREETTPGFLKSGYIPKSGSLLQAKVKMFDQENINPPVPTIPMRSKARPLDPRRGSNLFATSDEQTSDLTAINRATENGHLNYHSFCKQFAPFASKNPTDHRTNPWSNGNIVKNNSIKINAREKFQVREKTVTSFNDDNRKIPKVPVTYQAGNRDEKPETREKKEKSRHRKLYETYDGSGETNGVSSGPRDVVAYPFEINYQKQTNFGKKFRDNSTEKGDCEDPENLQQRRSSSPTNSSLQYIKSVLPPARNPSPPPRSIFSVQSVAVQTNQSEPPRPVYTKENFEYSSQNENPRRQVPPPPLPNDASLQGRLLTEQNRRGSRRYTDNLIVDPYQASANSLTTIQRDDPPVYAATTQQTINYPAQGHPHLPQNITQDNHYPLNTDYKTRNYTTTESKQPYSLNSYGQIAPQVPVRANPPQKVNQTITKNPQDSGENYERYEKCSYDNFESPERIRDYQDYPTNFYRDSINQNPIYVPPKPVDRENNSENHNPLSHLISESASYSSDARNPEVSRSFDDLESGDISEDHSYADDENIQNQDITSEGIVTRYASAVATVSSASESPAVSPLPSYNLKETENDKTSRIFEENLPIDRCEIPAYREDRSCDSEDLTLDEIRRHNLLQQNLIRQLRGDQLSVVANTTRRLSREAAYRDERSSSSPLNYSAKLQEDQSDEPVIESNNTQEKINIFEGRNNSMRKQQQQQHFKPLSIPRGEKESFIPPKINVVSPSKVFKPSFNADARGTKNTSVKLSQKNASSVDSSDEYLMSCASKPSRSIVLSKSESWHQLAMSKSTLQVPQIKANSLLKPPKPKSPSSLRLSKQYEASSSSDVVKKMEEKIQRYFQGPSPSGLPDSPVATRRDTKNKRNFAARKSQGSLMRSHTMPHIYDETTDVEKAFDSLFKEATRADNRY